MSETGESFEEQLKRIDADLAGDGVPIELRGMAASKRLMNDAKMFAGFDTFGKVEDWFRRKYGDRSLQNPDRGRIPLWISGAVFVGRVPLVFGAVALEPFKLIAGLTAEVLDSLSVSEKACVVEQFKAGVDLVYELDTLRNRESAPVPSLRLGGVALDFLKAAVSDCARAVDALEVSDFRNSCFHSQQFAEKIMKCFLAERKGAKSDAEVRSYGHKLQKLLQACSAESVRFYDVANDVHPLSKVTMDVRYSESRFPVPPKVAVDVFWCALRISGVASSELTGHRRRDGKHV